MLLQPRIDGVVPQDAVLRLDHPVVPVRELQQLGFDALALQRGERGQALVHRHAVIPVSYTHLDVYKRQGRRGAGLHGAVHFLSLIHI